MPAVAVDILSEECNLTIAIVEEVGCLADNGLCIATTLTTASVGDDAVGTIVLASTHNADVCCYAVGVVTDGDNVVIGLAVAEKSFGKAIALLDTREHRWELTVGIRTDDEADIILFGHELVFQSLSHTAEDADFDPGAITLEGTKLTETLADSLLSIVTDGTGIDENIVAKVDVLYLLVTLAREDGSDNFAVGKVHLATISLYIYSVFQSLIKIDDSIIKIQSYKFFLKCM